MSGGLGIPVVPITAVKGEGVSELVDQAVQRPAQNLAAPGL